MHDIMKLLAKKKEQGEEMSPEEQSGRMSVLESLKREMQGLMKGDLEKGPHVAESLPLDAGKDDEEKPSPHDQHETEEEIDAQGDEPLAEIEADQKEESHPIDEMAADKSPEEIDLMIQRLHSHKMSKK